MRGVVIGGVFAFAMCMLACSSGSPGENVDQSSAAVIGGTTDTGHPAVVQTKIDYGNGSTGYCTGTLISPTHVLTAGHCVEGGTASSKAAVYFGTYGSAAPASDWKPAKAFKAHPLYPHPYINQGHDCAILTLEDAVTNIAPIPYNHTAMDASWVGLAATIVGFGVTNGTAQTGSGTKRLLATSIKGVADGVLTIGGFGGTSCQGDSGGPTLMMRSGVETVVGISSYGVQGCTDAGSYSRAELCAPWIDSVVGTTCTPTCSGKACGGDGCGGSCGSCAAGETCDAGLCKVGACVPQCSGKQCGADGCGGSCGACSGADTCSSAGQCQKPAGGECDEKEPNDSFSNAESVCASGKLRGTLSSTGDYDTYKLTIGAGKTYDMRLKAPASVNIVLYKSTASGFSNIESVLDGDDRLIHQTTPNGGSYYLMVYRYQSGSTPGESWSLAVDIK